ncbi:MAG: aromatic ring-hydroxylating dioxygenase subunit alpha [Acidimicrobiaceae bacterium]|nr:aromatic ring-hydroxylating dioxygenase subunit alpha [Acidimicrobiaceae bacterium]MCO5330718.1 aromatic ring-hydroxylating dioxygenase subunit alpha [Ilumatobacteraceae bacterium]
MTTTNDEQQITIGARRSPGPSVQDLHRADTGPVPRALLDESYVPQGQADVPKARYTSPAFAALENEFMWTSTWQLACLADEIRQPGDHVVYDVADQSLLVTRLRDGSIRAFHNACLHRGTKLRTEDGRVASFRCPFHGWRWDLDGTLAEIPGGWDFPHITCDATRSCLPEAQVAEWQGFVFVNMDPTAAPFEEVAAKLIDHFSDSFDYANRYCTFHAVKEVPANWKVCMEAFSEGYHVIATHPQIVEFAGDDNSEYSIWPDSKYVTRFVNGFGIQSPHLAEIPQQQILDAYLAFSSKAAQRVGSATNAPVPEGKTARQVAAEVFRAGMGARYGTDLSAYSDTEILDAHLYHLFPAFAPWAGIGQPLVYRWRPGATPDTCFMDVYRMAPVPDGQERPAPAECQRLTLEQEWHEAAGMGQLADVFAQDMSNFPRVQAGLKSTGKRGVTFGDYQEARLRLIHRNIDECILAGLAASGRSHAEAQPYLVPEG